MKFKTQLALVAILLSLCAHVYLTLHYYPLKFGFDAAPSVCNLNATFNCDSVATSGYASFLGIPLALWGAVTQFVLFYFVLMGWLEWSEYPERTRRAAFVLASISAATSVVMGGISAILMKSYCIVCMGLYVLSFVALWACRGLLREPFWMHAKRDLPVLWSKGRDIVIAFALIPIGAFLAHQSFLVNYNASEMESAIADSMSTWRGGPKHDFVAKPMLTTGPGEGATLTLVEFADFRCTHCKDASHALDAFAGSHPDVRFEFYAFPLDGQCNEKIGQGDGISCRLAFAVACAEKDNHGWAMHHAIFEEQDRINTMSSTAEVDVTLARLVTAQGLSWERFQSCLADSATADAVKAQAKQGGLVDVKGTPTIYANGRALPRAQWMPVLDAAREASLHKNGM